MQHEKDISHYLCVLYRKVLFNNWYPQSNKIKRKKKQKMESKKAKQRQLN